MSWSWKSAATAAACYLAAFAFGVAVHLVKES